MGSPVRYRRCPATVWGKGLEGKPESLHDGNHQPYSGHGYCVRRAHAVFDLIVVDVSFVSLLKVLPSIKQLLHPDGDCIALFKPQFEVGKHNISKTGVVRNKAAITQASTEFVEALEGIGFVVQAKCCSPICGSDGNQEFLFHLKYKTQYANIEI